MVFDDNELKQKMIKVESQISIITKQSVDLSETNPLDTHKLSSV